MPIALDAIVDAESVRACGTRLFVAQQISPNRRANGIKFGNVQTFPSPDRIERSRRGTHQPCGPASSLLNYLGATQIDWCNSLS
jgi:hypothetical protein